MHLSWCLAFTSAALAGVADASYNCRPFVMPRAVKTTTSSLSVKTSSKTTSSSNTGSSSATVTSSSSQSKSSTTTTGNAAARVATSSTTTFSSVMKTTTTAAIVTVAAAPTATPVCGRSSSCRALSKFYNVALKQCANCQTGAKSCSNATTATACLRNYYLSGSSCVATCPDGSWGDASSFKCIACTDTDAATCSKAVPGAITCKTKYAYKGTCVAPCPDHFRMEPSNRTCMACSYPDAGDCTPLAAVRCLTKFLSNGKCVDTCPDAKTFADAKWHTCTPCPADSTSCDAKGLALGCATKFLSLGACVDSCPTNSYTNLATKTCSACADGVLGCSATGDTSCGTTVAGAKLFLDSLKSKCVPSTSCSTRFFGNSATGKCEKCAVDGALTCMPATVALTCGTNSASMPTFLSSGSCVASCPVGFYGQSGKCLPCGANALTCDATGAARACATNTYLSAGACVTVCPTSTFADKTSGTCIACGTGVLTCTSAAIAKTCGLDQYNNQLYLLNGRCAPASPCPTWSFPNPSSQKCIQCTSLFPGSLTCNAKGALSCGQNSVGKQLFLTSTQNCVEAAQCVVGTYPDTSKGQCVTCNDGVTACTGLDASQALTCGTTSRSVPLFLDPTTTSCVAQCPTKYYPVPGSSSCVKCDDGDDACTGNGNGTALVCGVNSLGQKTYMSPTNDCVEGPKCGQIGAYYPDDYLKACVSCDEGELACTADGFGAATKCGKLPATGEQLYLFQGDCYTGPNCPQGTFVNDGDNTCTSCPAGVLLCDAIDNANLCAPSLNGQALFMNAGKCVTTDKCPLGTYGKPGPFVCASCLELDSQAKQCDINNRATLCFPGWWARLSDGVCVPRSSCDSSYYINDGPRTCTPCERIQHNSATCTATLAKSCKPGSYLLNGVCLASCPIPGYFQEDATWSCIPCGSLFAHATMCDRSSLYACEGGWAVMKDSNDNRVCTSNCDPGLSYVISGGFVTQDAGKYDPVIAQKVPFKVQGCYPCTSKFGEFAFTCSENDLGSCNPQQAFIMENECFEYNHCDNNYAYCVACEAAKGAIEDGAAGFAAGLITGTICCAFDSC